MLKELDTKTEKMEATGFMDAKTLQEKFASLDKTKRTIGYCQTGTRSTLTYLELRLLGFTDPATGMNPGGFILQTWLPTLRLKMSNGTTLTA